MFGEQNEIILIQALKQRLSRGLFFRRRLVSTLHLPKFSTLLNCISHLSILTISLVQTSHLSEMSEISDICKHKFLSTNSLSRNVCSLNMEISRERISPAARRVSIIFYFTTKLKSFSFLDFFFIVRDHLL